METKSKFHFRVEKSYLAQVNLSGLVYVGCLLIPGDNFTPNIDKPMRIMRMVNNISLRFDADGLNVTFEEFSIETRFSIDASQNVVMFYLNMLLVNGK